MQNAASKLEDIETKGWGVPGAGILLQWFPLWTGWYAAPSASPELSARYLTNYVKQSDFEIKNVGPLMRPFCSKTSYCMR
jgi:hypothetical protein